ncbi:DUF7284 family protein [Haloplanus salilacus]|uniref:DUF7284 family protein n=1 Tax=Haloplanus salilacus TaxID=2949994 RepID=UPI0030CE7709
MTSTVLDGVLCLLLISGAVVTVTTATPREATGEGRAPDVSSTLATTTTSVNYTLEPTTGDGARVSVDRTAHGTLAELLARAAVGRITVDGRRLSHARDGLGAAVASAVRGAIQENHTRVTAVWRPYPGPSIKGHVAVGARPPPDVPVHAATMTVSSGFPTRRDETRDAARARGIEGVADVVAEGFVEGLFPPTRTRVAAGGARPVSAVIRHRYRQATERFGVGRSTRLASGGVDDTNERLAAAVSDRVARDLGATNASARAVSERVGLGRVRITVRTWP